ncbi:hypothetical protein [Streptomyces hirsutus]
MSPRKHSTFDEDWAPVAAGHGPAAMVHLFIGRGIAFIGRGIANSLHRR